MIYINFVKKMELYIIYKKRRIINKLKYIMDAKDIIIKLNIKPKKMDVLHLLIFIKI